MKQRYDRGGSYFLIVIIIIVAIPFWLPVMVLTVNKCYFTPGRNIENSWDISAPTVFSQIYHTSSDSIYARADGYTVYETPKDVSGFVDGFNFKKQSSVEDYVKEITARLSVPKSYRPQFEKSYCFLYKSSGEDKIVVVYFPELNQCFFVESFSWDE